MGRHAAIGDRDVDLTESVYWVELTGKALRRAPGSRSKPERHRLSTPEELRASFRAGNRNAVWVAQRAEDLAGLASEQVQPKSERRLLLLDQIDTAVSHVLQALFRSVVTVRGGLKILPREELEEVLLAENRQDLFIGGVVGSADRVLVLYRGDMIPLIVPFDSFRIAGDGIVPDFSDFAVIDYGQTVRLGRYEAAADAILHELDKEYRARARKNMIASDETPGSSIRRLRLQRGVARTGFPGISEKTIARIERNEVTPRKKTREIIARTLGVGVEELGSW